MKALDYSLPWGRKGEDVFTQDWDDFQQDIHKKRLKHMKPEVRKFMQSPKQGLSVETRDAKRKALKRARYLDIELENRVLLNKLSHLMRHPAEIFQAMEGERVGPRSLNKLTREKEYKRINRENNKLVSRIERGKGEYSRHKWAKERKKTQKYLNNLSRYDKKTGKRKCMRYSQRGKKNRARSINSKKKRNWARSLPSIGDADSGGYDGVDMSASAPSFQISGTIGAQESRDVMLNTTIQSGGMNVNSMNNGNNYNNNNNNRDSGKRTKNDMLLEQKYGSSGRTGAEMLAEAKKTKRRKEMNLPAPPRLDDRIPDNTKIYEVGRNLSGVFTILSAITRGKMLVIQAYVPSDQVTVEKMLSVHDVQRIMSDQIELLQRYKREELCRALINRVTFFFRDGKRVLLIEEGKKKVKSPKKKKKKQNSQQQQQQQRQKVSSPTNNDKNNKNASEMKNNINVEKSTKSKMSKEERNDQKSLDARLSKIFRCVIKLPRNTHHGQYLLCNVYEGWQLQALNMTSMEVLQARIPPQMSDQLTAPGIQKRDRISILREFLIEENIVKKPKGKFDVHENRKKRRDNRKK